MRKYLGAILFSVAFAAMFFAALPSGIPASTTVNAAVDVETDTYFPGRFNWFTTYYYETNGIFIYKPNAAVGENDVFIGDVTVDLRSLPYYDFEFEPLREVNGRWEVTNWFEVEKSYSGISCNWTLRKKLPAGKYGIRATAYHTVNGVRQPVIVSEWGEEITVNLVYIILYADDLNYIMCAESEVLANGTANSYKNSGAYDVRKRGLGGHVDINVSVNSGAMDKEALTPDSVTDDVTLGNLVLPAYIALSDMRVSVELNGVEIDSSIFNLNIDGNKISLDIPQSLGTGRYMVKVSHPSIDAFYGSYTIDNGGATPGSTVNMGPFFLIFGLIIGIGAAGLFVAPRLITKIQDTRYAGIENARYMEGVTDDKHYKAQSARSSYKNAKKISKLGELNEDVMTPEQKEEINRNRAEQLKETKSTGFLAKMYENRAKRDAARNAGLTMEEFRALEKEADKFSTAISHSLHDVRKSMEEKPEDTEIVVGPDKQSTERLSGEPEFEMLDSVKAEAPLRGAQFHDAVDPTTKPSTTSILARMRNLTGEYAQTSSPNPVPQHNNITRPQNASAPAPFPGRAPVPQPYPAHAQAPRPTPAPSAPAPTPAPAPAPSAPPNGPAPIPKQAMVESVIARLRRISGEGGNN